MPRKLTFRQLVVSVLALWYDLSHKEIGAAAGIPQKEVSRYLRRRGTKEETLDRLLAAIPCPPAAVPIVTACLESLDALEAERDLTAEEREEVEKSALEIARLTRETLTEAVRLSRERPARGYPSSSQAALDRERAEELWLLLKDLPESARLAVVRGAEEFQSWALCERVCAESVTEASRDLDRADSLASLAQEIAERTGGPQVWRDRLRGYAAAHVANVLRVAGDLKAADFRLEEANLLWRSGSDPSELLDPGRLLDLEASLRRDQRRLDEALALLDQALSIGRSPARVLVKKGFTLEVMGEYHRAVETLLQAIPLVEDQGDLRLRNLLYGNLAFNYCHLGRFAEAGELARRAREFATGMGDEITLARHIWLDGRIAAGLGRSAEALELLAQARRQFAARNMGYDVALALLEEAILLLDQGLNKEVKQLARELTNVFGSQGVHREALASLRLFQNEARREEATAEKTRLLLGYLFRARYDQSLRFEL